jgi:hypothetical protein
MLAPKERAFRHLIEAAAEKMGRTNDIQQKTLDRREVEMSETPTLQKHDSLESA